MEQIYKFDEKLKQINSYFFLMLAIPKYLSLVIGFCFMLFPIGEPLIMFAAWEMLGLAFLFHLRPYLHMKQNGKFVSIYKILKQTPIKKSVYRQARYHRMASFLLKSFAFSLLLQFAGLLLDKNMTIQSILYSVSYVVLTFASFALIGALEIWWNSR